MRGVVTMVWVVDAAGGRGECLSAVVHGAHTSESERGGVMGMVAVVRVVVVVLSGLRSGGVVVGVGVVLMTAGGPSGWWRSVDGKGGPPSCLLRTGTDIVRGIFVARLLA